MRRSASKNMHSTATENAWIPSTSLATQEKVEHLDSYFLHHFRVSICRTPVAVACMKRFIASSYNMLILFSSGTISNRDIGPSRQPIVPTLSAATELYSRTASESASTSFEKLVSRSMPNITSGLHTSGSYFLNFSSNRSSMSTIQASASSTASWHLRWRSLYTAMLIEKLTLSYMDCCFFSSVAVCRNFFYMRTALKKSSSTTYRVFISSTRLQTAVKAQRAW